jgi:hypothetical protein
VLDWRGLLPYLHLHLGAKQSLVLVAAQRSRLRMSLRLRRGRGQGRQPLFTHTRSCCKWGARRTIKRQLRASANSKFVD